MIKKLEDLLKLKAKKMKLAVVAAQDEEVLEAVIESAKRDIADPILIGEKEKIIKIAKEHQLDIKGYEIIDEKDLEKSAEIGVKLVSEKKADFIMKGLLDTSILLKAVLNKEWGLRTDSLISHVMVYEVNTYHKLLYLTDGGMNLEPTLEEKAKIISNAVTVVKAMGNKEVNVAVLAAKEKVNPKMQATVDADKLVQMCKNGNFESGVNIEGPLALDLAISKEAAAIKSISGKVAGDADVLLVPNIEMGNGIGKSITYFAKGESAGIVMGAKAPIVLVSRADDKEAKLYSIALGNMIAAYLEADIKEQN